MSKVYSLKSIQKIPVDINTAWDFFSKPGNLNAITPKKLGFKIISAYHEEEMYAGQIIEYTVKPLLGVPLYWMTEITHVKDKIYFIDEQRFGPYSLWHHQHHFKQVGDGIEMTDLVHYKLPFWFIGDVANAVLVKNQLTEIFQFRHKAVEEKFGKLENNKFNIAFK
ncbi:MAG: SRPBCC family protein, partial [Parafilimonas sp.]